MVTFKRGWDKLYYTQHTLLNNVRKLNTHTQGKGKGVELVFYHFKMSPFSLLSFKCVFFFFLFFFFLSFKSLERPMLKRLCYGNFWLHHIIIPLAWFNRKTKIAHFETLEMNSVCLKLEGNKTTHRVNYKDQ